jgi:hypothetical protein
VKNVKEVKKLNKILEKETEQREFQKYITYYFLKKGQSKSLSTKKKEQDHKMQEKADKLGEIENQNEEKRKELIKKMNKMDKKREEYMKLKNEKMNEDKIRRKENKKILDDRKNERNEEEDEKRKEVLEYQTDLVHRSMNKTKRNTRKNNSSLNSISNQIALKNNLTIFNKKLNFLKSQSVTKKTLGEKIKMYKEIKRKEAEKLKREKEEEMLYKGH